MPTYAERLKAMTGGIENAQKMQAAGHLSKAALRRMIKKLRDECENPAVPAVVGGALHFLAPP